MAYAKLFPAVRRAGRRQAEGSRGPTVAPRVDILETGQGLTLYAEVPGVRPEDVELRYEDGELVLHARRRRCWNGDYLVHECTDGDFYRVYRVREAVDGTRIEATCKNGVLTVHLPKVEAARTRQVKVRGGPNQAI